MKNYNNEVKLENIFFYFLTENRHLVECINILILHSLFFLFKLVQKLISKNFYFLSNFLNFFEKIVNFWKSRTKIGFEKKMSILTNLREQIVIFGPWFLNFLYLDPSILIKILIFDHFFIHLGCKNDFFSIINFFSKSIIFHSNYEKKCQIG